MRRLREELDFTPTSTAGSLASEVFTAWVPVGDFHELHAQGFAVATAAAQTLTVRLQTATDGAGTGAANLGTAAVATAAGAGIIQAQISQPVAGFPASATHVRAGFVASAALNGAGYLIRGEPRYSIA